MSIFKMRTRHTTVALYLCRHGNFGSFLFSRIQLVGLARSGCYTLGDYIHFENPAAKGYLFGVAGHSTTHEVLYY